MKYWKHGFYDSQITGSTEISEEYYHSLLEGQSLGSLIEEDKNGLPVLVKREPSIKDLIAQKIAEIQEYDKSEAVNSFTLNGLLMWLDRETRVGLVNSIKVEQQSGKTNTTLWYGVNKVELPVQTALAMLDTLEIYALRSYNVTQSHLANVMKLTTKEEIDLYDFTKGYPEKIRF